MLVSVPYNTATPSDVNQYSIDLSQGEGIRERERKKEKENELELESSMCEMLITLDS